MFQQALIFKKKYEEVKESFTPIFSSDDVENLKKNQELDFDKNLENMMEIELDEKTLEKRISEYEQFLIWLETNVKNFF